MHLRDGDFFINGDPSSDHTCSMSYIAMACGEKRTASEACI